MRWWFLILYWCTVSRKEWECLCKTFEINLHIFVYFKILFNIIDWFLLALAIFPFIFWCVSYLRVLFQSSALGLLEGPASAWLMAVFAFFLSQSSSLFTYTLYYHGYIKSVITPKWRHLYLEILSLHRTYFLSLLGAFAPSCRYSKSEVFLHFWAEHFVRSVSKFNGKNSTGTCCINGLLKSAL